MRIAKASTLFQWLGPIWTLSTISMVTKICLYMSIVVPTAAYGSETWKITMKIVHQLDVFYQRCLWNILRIMWRVRVTNEEALQRSGQRQMSNIVTKRRLQWAGHALHLPASWLMKVAMSWTWWRQAWERVAQEDVVEYFLARLVREGCQ